jgi:hypothetical protein
LTRIAAATAVQRRRRARFVVVAARCSSGGFSRRTRFWMHFYLHALCFKNASHIFEGGPGARVVPAWKNRSRRSILIHLDALNMHFLNVHTCDYMYAVLGALYMRGPAYPRVPTARAEASLPPPLVKHTHFYKQCKVCHKEDDAKRETHSQDTWR